tara:strand:- start:1993 stop:2289 length:297 start_codon:yes stop_codon:yes gene_type:complete
MIDIDKYERMLKDDDGRNSVFALDLLAEVKRLRKRQETMMHWLLKTRDSDWEDKEYVLTRIDEGYDLDTVIEIYEARVDMYACGIEADILDTLKELIE